MILRFPAGDAVVLRNKVQYVFRARGGKHQLYFVECGGQVNDAQVPDVRCQQTLLLGAVMGPALG